MGSPCRPGGGPMMPPSTKCAPVEPIIEAIRCTVSALTALQSTNIAFRATRDSGGAKRFAKASASAGGSAERITSACAIASSSHPIIFATSARRTVATLRPVSEVSTLAPCSLRRRPTAAPISPGAITAIVEIISPSPLAPFQSGPPELGDAAVLCPRRPVTMLGPRRSAWARPREIVALAKLTVPESGNCRS